MVAPLLDDDSRLLQTVEDLTVEALVAQFAVEGFAVAVLPGTARLDVERLCSERCEPTAHDLCGHLRTVVRPDMLRDASGEHHVGHRLKDAEAVDPTSHPDRQAFPGELVDQGHQPNLAPIVGLRLDEVVTPNMIAMLWSQPDAGSVVEPEPASRLLLPGYFQPLTAPDPLDAITSDLPAGVGQQ
jgi:hypothetical protein